MLTSSNQPYSRYQATSKCQSYTRQLQFYRLSVQERMYDFQYATVTWRAAGAGGHGLFTTTEQHMAVLL